MIELNDETHEHIFPIAAGFGFTAVQGLYGFLLGEWYAICFPTERCRIHEIEISTGTGAGAQKPTKTWFAWIDFLTFINLLGSKPLILPGTNLGGPCGDPER